ncbi:MAG: Hpt domain-containing protein [Eggerthellaceae bacterium]|nr:Hpt domain-containing protein [Eggerthellaceae bacterium]
MTLDDLRAFGADVDEGLARCMGKEDFYLRLVGMAQDETGYNKLEQAIADGDLKAGFEAAHGLKGVLGNLALTPLLEPVSEITELLRAGTEMDYSDLLAQIKEQKERFLAL